MSIDMQWIVAKIQERDESGQNSDSEPVPESYVNKRADQRDRHEKSSGISRQMTRMYFSKNRH